MSAQSIYKLQEGSVQYEFHSSRKKFQIFGGGFGNGKTAAMCIKGLSIAHDYPGANILVARSTYPKLNDTIRKELLKWCPAKWIKRRPTKDDNTLILKNDTTINFRYIDQQGRGAEDTTSNLLSATYDLIIVDQMEDPEIVEKDFDDLIGRLRGSTPYVGDDPTMPRTGPRLMLVSCNPTSNWVYHKLVKPIHTYNNTGFVTKDLLCLREEGRTPILDDDGNPTLIVDLFEGPTHINAANLAEDFIETLESTYTGQMRDRFLLGKWAAYEGLVYSVYNEAIHNIERSEALDYLTALRRHHVEPEWIEGYDHGLAVPSCWLLAFVDPFGNVIVVDGMHEKECPPADTIRFVKQHREVYRAPQSTRIYADPSIFKRGAAGKSTVGNTVARIFHDEGKGLHMIPGNNNIINGIIKVQSYLIPVKGHTHPLTKQRGAPHLYIVNDLEFLPKEFSSYFWKKSADGKYEDKPRDGGDDAMDSLKFLLSKRPNAAVVMVPKVPTKDALLSWHEQDAQQTANSHRYGRTAA